jgi:uncharacterized protein (TIRG00374 family)
VSTSPPAPPSTATSPRARSDATARTAVVLGTNLVVASAGLAWALARFGGPALAVLERRPSVPLLGAFLATAAAGLVCYAARWRVLLGGLGTSPPLRRLIAYRAAGQSLSALIPSAKLGGEPLRVYLLMRDAVPAPHAIASVAVDRTLEMGVASAGALLYAVLLLRRGVPSLHGALVTVTLGAVALGVGVVIAARRLRRGSGLVTAMARRAGLDRLASAENPLAVAAESEAVAGALLAQPARIARAFVVGLLPALLNLLEYELLLAAFGLPAYPLAVVAAVFATGAAHSLPVPAAVGTLEGAQIWIFATLGHPPEVGLAVGLAVRLRELVWILTGLIYLAVRGMWRGMPKPATA